MTLCDGTVTAFFPEEGNLVMACSPSPEAFDRRIGLVEFAWVKMAGLSILYQLFGSRLGSLNCLLLYPLY